MQRTSADILGEEQIKDLLRQVLVELLQDRRSEFRQLVLEAIEEVGLANAIREGRKNEFVDPSLLDQL
ncbi:MAG: hypothetical protein GXO73_03175 [Calditrichaeota bacterium]|nr:hypothetical protein [Calditrichota bacterium]